MVMTRKYIDDMFHSLRTHVCLTWILAMVMHIVTGNIGDTFGQFLETILRLIFRSISRSILGTFAILGTIWGHFRVNRNYINDMFHSLRTQCLTWILAMVMHIVTGNILDTFGDIFKVDFWDKFWDNFGIFSGQS